MIATANRGLRLFFIVENDEPHAAAGGFYALFKFAEFLARRGNHVRLYGVQDLRWASSGGNLELVFRPRLPRLGKALTWIDRRLSRLSARFLMPRQARRFRPDWIAGVLTYSAINAEALGRKLGVPVANFVYECPPWMEQVLGPERFRQAQDGFSMRLWEATRRAYLGSRVLFPNSRLSAEFNAAWLEGKAVAEPIHPGIDPEQMPLEAPALGEPMPLERDCDSILYVGRLAHDKHVDILITAFRKLGRKAVLHICGAGSERKRLEALAGPGDSIRFHGYLPDAKLWSLFRQCRLVAYPTGFEGFGMPPMQALYFGKPCLASDLPVLRSVYGDLLEYFPTGDVQALAAGLDRLLADPEYCRRRGETGRSHILGNFTWSHAAGRIERALRETDRTL